MTRWHGSLIQVWGWLSVALVAAALAAALGLLMARLGPGVGDVVLQALLDTVPAVAGALALAAPIALMSAISLDQVLPRGATTRLLRRLVAAAAGVPAIVYGVVGATLAPWLGVGTVSVVLALAVTPSLTQGLLRVLRRAEPEERLAAQALGATPLQVLVHVVGPAAAGGITALVVRTAGSLVALAAPLLVLRPEGPMPIAWQVVQEAARGETSAAAALALTLLGVVVGARALALIADRRIAWRVP